MPKACPYNEGFLIKHQNPQILCVSPIIYPVKVIFIFINNLKSRLIDA